ncbi:MAG: MBL fold metallo-hydrolase [Clostridia bacterium]|nr:MBL fold metallo-hydrolase [Clostridia bacterium]
MKINFLGTGAAEGFPSVFCKCEYCKIARAAGEREYRSRTQILIDGELSIDYPPDAYANSLKRGVNLGDIKYLLVTHSHMDHFYAHDFILRGYKYAKNFERTLSIYGNAEVKAVYGECTAREMKPEVAANLNFTEIKPFSVFEAGGYKVIAIPAQHSQTEDALLFYIERNGKGYLHLHDSGRISGEALNFLAEKGAKAQAVAFDCTFIGYTAGEVSRHMGIEDNMLMKSKLQDLGVIDENSRIIITHFSHNSNPTLANLKVVEKKYSVTAAYDGMTIEI